MRQQENEGSTQTPPSDCRILSVGADRDGRATRGLCRTPSKATGARKPDRLPELTVIWEGLCRSPLCRASVVLGLGLGGFFDGIVLHQILGWHHMICATSTCQPTSVEHLKRQITQDGYFHLSVWIITITGIVLLFRAAPTPSQHWSGKTLLGGILAGWGAFNFMEGLIDHQILGLHHVLPGHPRQFLFDMSFLASGLFLAAIGSGLLRSEDRKEIPTRHLP